MAVRVLIVDDHAAFRTSAHALLEAEGLVVVGEASDAAGAVEAVVRLRPDLVLLDIQLPDADGFEVADRLAAHPSPPAVVLISSRAARTYGPRLASARVAGFVPKAELSGAALLRILG